MTPLPFLVLTFVISLTGFLCILLIPSARSPDTLAGLPFWLIMVWGPSLAAIMLAFRHGHLSDLLSRAVTVSTVPIGVWLLVVAPIFMVLVLRPFAPDATTPLGGGMLAAMVAFNLILGPLGEELGWRGVLQDHWSRQWGWLATSLAVGAIWLIWHLPLWLIDSPHAQIALPIFGAHVMLYAVIIGAAYTLSGGSILPAILLHLTFNVAANSAVFAGFRDPNAWFISSLVPYLLLAIAAMALVYARGAESLRWI